MIRSTSSLRTSPGAARRMRVVLLALASLVVVMLTGCGGEKQVRIHNVSGHDFDDVRVANRSFGDLAAGETGDYRKVLLPSRYAVIELTIEGRPVTGQTLNLGSRELTYRIDVADPATGQLDITVLRD